MSGATPIWIHGYSGKMGAEIRGLIDLEAERWELLGGTGLGQLIDRKLGREEWDWAHLPQHLRNVELIIDFSAAPANQELFKVMQQERISNKAILIGTTGLDASAKEAWDVLAKQLNLRLLQAPNTSLGVLLTLKVSELIGKVLNPLGFDVELLETHHREKIDAPSGTAKFLAEGVAKALNKKLIYGREGKRLASEIGVASLRGGTVFGEHEVRFLGDHEELVVSHRALTRKLFAQGALLLSAWLIKQKPSAYRLENIGIEEMVALLQSQAYSQRRP